MFLSVRSNSITELLGSPTGLLPQWRILRKKNSTPCGLKFNTRLMRGEKDYQMFWKINRLVLSLLAPLLSIASAKSLWGSEPAQFLSVPDVVVIKAGTRTPPPEWAILERHLMKAIDQAAPIYLKAFTFQGGTLRKGGKIDDDYESLIGRAHV